MAITKVNNVASRYSDPSRVIFVPWENGDTLGTNGYDIHAIVGDTFSLTQDDAERNEIPHEFSDDPLDENVSMGNRTLSMQCLDFADEIMVNLFGCTKDATTGIVSFPSDYTDLWCLVQLEFDDKAVVMPKVKMDAKTVFENLRSDIARGELTGTLYSTDVTVSNANVETPLMFVPAGKDYSIGKVKITVGQGTTATAIEEATTPESGS